MMLVMSGHPSPKQDPPRLRSTVATDGVRISYLVDDGTGPPFVQIRTPGAPPLSLVTSPLIEPPELTARFNRGRKQVRFDWRGAGASDRVVRPLSIDDLIADIEAVIAAVGGPVDARVWGRACFTACIHAAQRPELYRSMHLNGAALRAGESWQGFYNRPGWEPHYSAHLQGIARHYFSVSDEEAVELALRWEHGVPQESFEAYLEAEQDADLTEILPRINIPAWVTARLPIDYEPAAEIAALLPNSILTLYTPDEAGILGPHGRDEWDRHLGSALGDAPSAPLGAPAVAAQSADHVHITAKEEEVLALIAQGDSNLEIAEALGIVEGTVKRHVSNLLQKTGLKNRRQLMRFADGRDGEA